MQMRLVTVHVHRSCRGNIDSSFCCVHSKHEPPRCSALALPSQHTPRKSPVKTNCQPTGASLHSLLITPVIKC